MMEPKKVKIIISDDTTAFIPPSMYGTKPQEISLQADQNYCPSYVTAE